MDSNTKTVQILNYDIPLSEISSDDMPNDVMREVYDFCGVEVAVSLLLHMRGNQILVPTKGLKLLERKIINKFYDGTASSIRTIARKLKISEVYIRHILKNLK